MQQIPPLPPGSLHPCVAELQIQEAGGLSWHRTSQGPNLHQLNSYHQRGRVYLHRRGYRGWDYKDRGEYHARSLSEQQQTAFIGKEQPPGMETLLPAPPVAIETFDGL